MKTGLFRQRGGVLAAAVFLLTGWGVRAQTVAPRFTGNNSYILLGTPAALQIPAGEPFTVEGWIRFNAFSIRDMLYSKNEARGAPYSYMLGLADGAMAAFDGSGWLGHFDLDGVTGQWVHLAFAYDGTEMTFYQDGDGLGSVAFEFDNDVAHTVKIGGYSNVSDTDGLFSDVRVWDHARDQAAIRATLRQRLLGTETGLLGYWPLDEGDGSIAYDATANQSDGSMLNATWTPDDDLRFGFIVVHPETGSDRFTNTNTLDVVSIPIYEGYDSFQITQDGASPIDDPAEWQSTNTLPVSHTFATPATDTNVLLTVWYTNSTPPAVLISNSAAIVYTTAQPVPVLAPVTRYLVDGVTTVTINFADLDDGSTGGDYHGEPIPFVVSLSCAGDITPDEPFVTLDALGVHDVLVTLTNAAGSVAAATGTVNVLSRGPTLYVRADAPASMPPYDSWATAATNLHDAMAIAGPYDTVRIAGQTAVLTSMIEWSYSGMTLRGGYQATETDPLLLPGPNDPERWPTVITRDPAGPEFRLFSIERLADLRLEQVELRDGFQRDGPGGGLYAAFVTNLHLADVRFVDNTAWRDAQAQEYGGGLYAQQTTGSISNSVFLNNTVRRGTYGAAHGGGLCIIGGDWTLANSVLAGNNTMVRWSNARGAGIYINGGIHDLRNILVIHNGRGDTATYTSGGGIYIEGNATVTIGNATVYGNEDHGVFVHVNSGVTVRNSIVMANNPDISGNPDLLHNCIGDGTGEGMDGNVSTDPRFEYPLYYLMPDSPAIHAGTGTVDEAGLLGWTSLTNGMEDTGTVNLGYHYPEGLGIDREFFVALDGDDEAAGTCWETALASISRALDRAGALRTRIHVAAGVYDAHGESFPLAMDGQAVQIIGSGADQTVVDATGSGERVFMIRNTVGDNRMETLTVRGGTGKNGAGLHVGGALLSLNKVIVRDNAASGSGAYGGGLYAIRSGVQVRDSVIASNHHSGSGYGTIHGAGIVIDRGSSACICHSRFLDNTMTAAVWGHARGVALAVSSSYVQLRNSLFTENRMLRESTESYSRLASGVFVMGGGHVRIDSCTIAFNNSEGLMGTENVEVFNTILWGNGRADFTNLTESAFQYSCASNLTTGLQGNIGCDPAFVNPQAGDYRLQLESPAVDAGINRSWMAGALDLQGLPRILYGRTSWTVDMGAYETVPLKGSVIRLR